MSGGSNLTLGPGTYIIDRGAFNITGGSSVTANGATIILTSSTGAGYATASISGGANVNISAPTSGSTAGLAFFQDRNAPTNGTDSFTGGATQNITGAIYFPSQSVSFSGGSATGGVGCTQLIAYKISFSGGSHFNNNCAGTGVRGIGSALVQIVE